MLFLIGLAAAFASACLLLLPFALRWFDVLHRYSGSRLVTCPENQRDATVKIDARLAAESAIDGTPQVRLCACTRWPERAQCGQQCAAQASDAVPYPEVEAKTKPIYHLPVLVAAFAAWCLGAIWHSQYMFLGVWTHAVGLTRTEVKLLTHEISPHLLTAAVCLLFAYGVAWLLVLCRRRGVMQGVMMAVLLCASIAAMSAFGILRIPRELLLIETGYSALATVTVGAIVGGFNGRLMISK
jgi:hypothetical protein